MRWGNNQKADPEKFCVNVWGAQLGEELFFGYAPDHPSGPIGAQRSRDVTVEERQQWDKLINDQAEREGLLAQRAPVTGDEPLDAFSFTNVPGAGVPLVATGSPVNITWQGVEGTLILHRATATLYGWFPVLILPVYDEVDGGWNVLGLDYASQPYSMSFEGTAAGTLHVTRFDPDNGQIATWVTPVQSGAVYRIDVIPGEIDTPLTGEDGSTVEPIINSVSSAEAPSPADPTPVSGVTEPDDTTPGAGGGVSTTVIGLIIGGPILFALIAVLLFRRHGKPPAPQARLTPAYATPLPQPPPAANPARSAPSPKQPAAPASSAPMSPVTRVDLMDTNRTSVACPRCGTRVGQEAAFCGTCGMKITRPTMVPAPRFCSQCGKRLAPDTDYCVVCGAPVPELD